MKKSFSIWQVLTLLVLVLPSVCLLWAWPALPARLPSHFADGAIDGYTRKADAWVLTTALPLGIYLLLLFLPRFDPRRRLSADSRSFHKISLLLVSGVSVLACYSLYLALHPGQLPGREMSVGLALFVALLGNYLSTVQPNYFMGMRTPWALESDVVWTKTHRLVGRLFFGGGLALALVAALGPQEWFDLLLLALVLGGTVSSYAYSYWVYRQLAAGLPQR